MTVAPELTADDVITDDVTFTASNGTASPPQRSAMTARRIGRFWAKPAALVVAVAVMWLIVLAIITIV